MNRKRLHETARWHKTWFFNLSPELKLAVAYIHDFCDPCGMFSVNIGLMNTMIGAKEPITYDTLKKHLPKKNFQFYDKNPDIEGSEDKILVLDFIEFQYGSISRKCRVHNNVFACLEKHGLTDWATKWIKDEFDRYKPKSAQYTLPDGEQPETEIERYIQYRQQEFDNLSEQFKKALKQNVKIERPVVWANRKIPQGYFDLVDCLVRVREDVEWRSNIQRTHNISKEKFLEYLYGFVGELINTKRYMTYDGYDGSDGKDNFIQHFAYWIKAKVEGR